LSGASSCDPTRGFASFRSRDFFLLLCGKTIGWIALYMTVFAIQFQVYDRTGDVENLAYIGLASFMPAIGFALFTGYVADRFDRRLVVAVCYVIVLISTALFLWYTVSGVAVVWPVFLILLFEGTGRAFHQPAITSLIPNLVPPETFPNAVAWHSTISKVTQVTGPALGGILYHYAGPATVYALGCVMLVVATVLTAMIRTRTGRGSRQPTTLTALFAGIRYVYAKKVIFGAITLDLFVVLLGGVTALFPVFAKDILNVGADGAGFLRSGMAAGALVSGLLLTQINLNRNVGRTMFLTVVVYGLATVVFGLSQNYWLSLASMAILGAFDMVSVNIRVTLLQIATPDDMRGRVSAVSAVFTGASNEIGEFRAGMMAAAIGAIPAVLVGGVGSLLVAAVCWKAFPELARVKRFEEVR
jgi:MFS family permease